MRYFDSEWSYPVQDPLKPEQCEAEHLERPENHPTEWEVLREIGLILLVCLGLAGAADLLVRAVGAH